MQCSGHLQECPAGGAGTVCTDMLVHSAVHERALPELLTALANAWCSIRGEWCALTRCRVLGLCQQCDWCCAAWACSWLTSRCPSRMVSASSRRKHSSTAISSPSPGSSKHTQGMDAQLGRPKGWRAAPALDDVASEQEKIDRVRTHAEPQLSRRGRRAT